MTFVKGSVLTQLGRLIKTIHILRYIHEEPLRQAFQLQLNSGLQPKPSGVGWNAVCRTPAPNVSSRKSTGSSNRGSTTMSAGHGPSEANREVGTLDVVLEGLP